MSAATDHTHHDGHDHGGPPDLGMLARKLPPVVEIAGAALVSVVVGGIYMASKFPHKPPMTLPIILLAIGTALMLANVVILTQIRDFAWQRFFIVFKWSLCAYVISAGMIEFAFLKNHIKGGPLVVVSGMLVIFATVVPLMIAFTVARYEDTDAEPRAA